MASRGKDLATRKKWINRKRKWSWLIFTQPSLFFFYINAFIFSFFCFYRPVRQETTSSSPTLLLHNKYHASAAIDCSLSTAGHDQGKTCMHAGKRSTFSFYAIHPLLWLRLLHRIQLYYESSCRQVYRDHFLIPPPSSQHDCFDDRPNTMVRFATLIVAPLKRCA